MTRYTSNILAAVAALFIAATSMTALVTVPTAQAHTAAAASAPALA